MSEKPMLLIAYLTGARGGANGIGIAKGRFPYMGGNIVSDLSFPSFFDNFKEGVIADENLNKQLQNAVDKLQQAL